MFDESKIKELLTVTREIAKQDFVVDITDHFAGYFDELGITIEVRPQTTDEQIETLKDQLLIAFSGRRPLFKWMVMFQRKGKSAGVLFPDGLFARD